MAVAPSAASRTSNFSRAPTSLNSCRIWESSSAKRSNGRGSLTGETRIVDRTVSPFIEESRAILRVLPNVAVYTVAGRVYPAATVLDGAKPPERAPCALRRGLPRRRGAHPARARTIRISVSVEVGGKPGGLRVGPEVR